MKRIQLHSAVQILVWAPIAGAAVLAAQESAPVSVLLVSFWV